jgi:hypothetical protein
MESKESVNFIGERGNLKYNAVYQKVTGFLSKTVSKTVTALQREIS